MHEYIEREAALKILRGDAVARYPSSFYYGLFAAADEVKKMPTADVVEVVRCKDCKHLYCLSAIDRRFYCRHWPKGLEGINIVEENPYCSYGERRDDNAR